MLNKIYIVLIIGAIAALIVSGVLEVKIHPDKISGISKNTLGLFKDQSMIEKSRAFFVKIKRRGEQFIIQDEEKRLELALLYVEKDSERLNRLIKENKDAANLLPSSQSLITSLNLVRSTAEDAPVEVVASLKDKSQKAFSSAQETLGELKDTHEQYESIQEEFTRLTESLEKQIGELDINEEDSTNEENEEEDSDKEEGSDESNESTETVETTTKEKIPLKF